MARDVVIDHLGTRQSKALPNKKTNYRRASGRTEKNLRHLPLAQSIDILGDKWTIEILVVIFMRLKGFTEIQRATGIASNILSDRLSRLTQQNVLFQLPSSASGKKMQYALTEKGLELYPIFLAIQFWADAWLPERVRSPLRLKHKPCNRYLALSMMSVADATPVEAAEGVFSLG